MAGTGIGIWQHRHTGEPSDIRGLDSDRPEALGAWCGVCRAPVFRLADGGPWRHLEQEAYLRSNPRGAVADEIELMAFGGGELIRSRIMRDPSGSTRAEYRQLAAEYRDEIYSADVVLVARLGRPIGWDVADGVGSDLPGGREWLARVGQWPH